MPVFLPFLFILLSFWSIAFGEEPIRESRIMMNTELSCIVYVPQGMKKVQARVRVNSAYSEAERLISILSFYDATSELSNINDAPPWLPIFLSEEMATALQKGKELAEASDGRFDVFHGAFFRQWKRGLRNGKPIADEARLRVLELGGEIGRAHV